MTRFLTQVEGRWLDRLVVQGPAEWKRAPERARRLLAVFRLGHSAHEASGG